MVKNPALLRTRKGVGFLDYWFFRTGKDEGYEECSGGRFHIQMNTIDGSLKYIPHSVMSIYTFFPKTFMGFWGAVNDFRINEGSFHRVGLRDLGKYICDNDKHFDVKLESLPDILAKKWEDCPMFSQNRSRPLRK